MMVRPPSRIRMRVKMPSLVRRVWRAEACSLVVVQSVEGRDRKRGLELKSVMRRMMKGMTLKKKKIHIMAVRVKVGGKVSADIRRDLLIRC